MVDENLIREIIFDFQEQKSPEFTRRTVNLECPSNKIRTIIGGRRVGKTYSFYQIMHDLISQGVLKEQFLFINFEDERLIQIEVSDLSKIYDTFFEIYPENKDRLTYIFFDEIQNVHNWERFIRRIHDTENVQINLTGSSAKLLSQEIATSLRGRTLTFEIYPFSFSEYLDHKKIKTKSRSSKNRAYIINAFHRYLKAGGYPETLDVEDSFRIMILQDYFNLVLYKDLVERYNIRNYALMKYLLRHLLVNSANPFSVNKVYSDLKSQGYKVSKDALHNYFAYLEEAFCISLVPILSTSIRKQQINYKKIYSLDHGMVTSLTKAFSQNQGNLLETMVYNQLRSIYNRDQIFYYKNSSNQEIDFLTYDRGKTCDLVQVCQSLKDRATKKREITALLQTMEELNLKKSFIISQDEFDTIENGKKTIQVIPFWDWAISEK